MKPRSQEFARNRTSLARARRSSHRLHPILVGYALLLCLNLGCTDVEVSEDTPPPGTTLPLSQSESNLQPDPSEDTARTYAAFQHQLQKLLSRADPAISTVETVSGGDHKVTTVAELLDALSSAEAGETVFVVGSARLDLSAVDRIEVPAHVRLASDRGVNGSTGAFLYSSNMGTTLFVAGEGAEFVGLNLMGPDPERRGYQIQWLFEEQGVEDVYRVPTAVGIEVSRNDVRIENCEIWAWSRAGVAFQGGSRGGVVRHCFLHHNRRRGLGYGVSVDAAEALIESNLFDWCRHAVASTGTKGSGYEARYNFILRNANGHSFDVHGGVDREDGTNIAGTWARVHHNIVVQTTYPGVSIRGVPLDRIEIHTNKFKIEDPEFAVRLRESSDRIVVSGNEYGVQIMR